MMREHNRLRRLRSVMRDDAAQAGGPLPLQRSPGGAASGNSFRSDHEKTRPAGIAGARPPGGSGRFPGRLNLFQATMLDWRDHHPYNAVHAVHVAAPLDAVRLVHAIDDELSHAGLAGLDLDRAGCRYAWRGGAPSVAFETVDAGGDWQQALAATFERHLNAPFPREGRLDPFRFFALPADSGFFLGLAYDHFVAGGDSIVVLLNAIVCRYAAIPGVPGPAGLYPRTHARLFVRHAWRFARSFVRLPELAASCRRTIRPRYRPPQDGRNAFTFFRLDAAQYAKLRATARSWGVTLNDALMALLLLAQDAARPGRDMAKRRCELAVASIINLRNEHGEDARTAFAQFLSSFRVAHRVPAGITLRELALDVHRTTARIKREKLYLLTLYAMAVDRVIGRFQTPAQRAGIYAKNYPVGAGLSSLNVDAMWQGAGAVPLYIRGVPTGPLSPIVVAVTTSGDTLCCGISYRTAAFGADDIARLEADIESRIRSLA